MAVVIPADVERELETRAPEIQSDADHQHRTHRLLLATAVVLGVLVRLYPAVTQDFALNDGALFYQMALEIKRAGFALPSATGYNADGIPFAYAPLGFYLAAALG